jgi:hypothetical protein
LALKKAVLKKAVLKGDGVEEGWFLPFRSGATSSFRRWAGRMSFLVARI